MTKMGFKAIPLEGCQQLIRNTYNLGNNYKPIKNKQNFKLVLNKKIYTLCCVEKYMAMWGRVVLRW